MVEYRALGKQSDAQMFAKGAQNYRNVRSCVDCVLLMCFHCQLWDPKTQWLCSRSVNRTLICPDDLEAATPYPFGRVISFSLFACLY